MATLLPDHNARVRKIAGGARSPNYRNPGTAGVTKWAGNEDAYISEKVETSFASGRRDRYKRTFAIIPIDLVPQVDLAADDIVTYDYQGQSYDRTVENFEAHPHIRGATVRIYFRDA